MVQRTDVNTMADVRTQPASPVARIAAALRRLQGRWASVLAFTLALGVVQAAVIAPIAAAVLRFFLQRWGRVSVGNFELAAFLLTPGGLAALIVTGGLTMTVLHLELGGLTLLLTDPTRRSWHALALLRRHVGLLLRLGLVQFGVLLLLALPVLAAMWGVYAALWAGYDVYGLLVLKPPVFWAGAIAGGLLVCVYTAAAATLLVRWSLAPLGVVLEPTTWAVVAMRRSAILTRGWRWAIARAVGLWLLLVVALAVVVMSMLQWTALWTLDRLSASLSLTLAATAVALALHAAVAVVLSAMGRAVMAGVLLGFIDAQTAPAVQGERAPSIQTRRKLLAGVAVAAAFSGVGVHSLIADLMLDDRVEITAHRAGAIAAPENTLAALRRAIADGADWAEIDVQLTADGGLVVIHDFDLLRVGGVRQRVAQLTLAQVQAIDVGARFGPAFAGERIPTLDAMLAEAGDRIGLNIELKLDRGADSAALVRATLDAVKRAGLTDRVRICSQSYAALRQVREIEPGIPIGFIAGAAMGDLTRLDVDFLMVSRRLARRQLVHAAASRGITIHAWTINDPRHVAALVDAGVTNIITDDPVAIRARLDAIRELSVPERLLLRAGHAMAR
jgi:glycerophosphoryl diester phosphodiesterase